MFLPVGFCELLIFAIIFVTNKRFSDRQFFYFEDMRIMIYTDDDKTVCKVKPREMLEFSYEGYIFADVEENLTDVVENG